MDELLNDAIDSTVLDQLAQDIGLETLPLLVDKLVGEMGPRTRSILNAVARQDADMVERESHILKSTTASFGALRVSTCAKTLEELARRGDWKTATLVAAPLPALMMGAIENFYQRGLTSRAEEAFDILKGLVP